MEERKTLKELYDDKNNHLFGFHFQSPLNPKEFFTVYQENVQCNKKGIIVEFSSQKDASFLRSGFIPQTEFSRYYPYDFYKYHRQSPLFDVVKIRLDGIYRWCEEKPCPLTSMDGIYLDSGDEDGDDRL